MLERNAALRRGASHGALGHAERRIRMGRFPPGAAERLKQTQRCPRADSPLPEGARVCAQTHALGIQDLELADAAKLGSGRR
jgi:hypothetical protein